MMQLRNTSQQFFSRIGAQIILPFIFLLLIVALLTAIATQYVVINTAQTRLLNEMIQSARDINDEIVLIESANLGQLRNIALAGENTNLTPPAPSIASAIANNDLEGLRRALLPYFIEGADRSYRLDRIIIFDQQKQTILDWERDPNAPNVPREDRLGNISALPVIDTVLASQSDEIGDKYAGLVNFNSRPYFFTVVPVAIDRGDNQREVIGGIIGAIDLDAIVNELAADDQRLLLTIYDPTSGTGFASSGANSANPSVLQIREALIGDLQATNPETSPIFDVTTINAREYQIAYSTMRVRNAVVALLSVASSTDTVTEPFNELQFQLVVTLVVTVIMISGMGIWIANRITKPINELVETAKQVTGGNYDRRSLVKSPEEIGTLAENFNKMTDELTTLIELVSAESTQRAAILESIGDGITVIDKDGAVISMNGAMRRMLALGEHDLLPVTVAEIPIQTLSSEAFRFGGQQMSEIYALGDLVIRLTRSPILNEEQAVIGYVYVFQDLTEEAAIDRAKTNFIATISHELRTPLTVISTNTDMLVGGWLGKLTDEQHERAATIQRHSRTMTNMINNVLAMASLDAGKTTYALAPINLEQLLRDNMHPFQRIAEARGLAFEIDVPSDLPEVIADDFLLRDALKQLVDNAVRYTQAGHVAIRAAVVAHEVVIMVEDSGNGIEADLRQSLFSRFQRGSEGINSVDRGIGLGLAIASELITLQQGRIWLDERWSSGTRFMVALPYRHVNIEQTANLTSFGI